MSRAPSTLPFALEPNPSPEQLQFQSQAQSYPQSQSQSQTPQKNQRYISNICRSGPMPLTRHTLTDPICTILYLLLLISTLTLFSINYFSGKLTITPTFADLNFFQKLSCTLSQTVPLVLLSCVCLVVIGMVFVGLVVAVPVFIGYFILVGLLGLLGVILYTQIGLKWGDVFQKMHGTHKVTYTYFTNDVFRICLIILTCLSILLTLYLLLSKLQKLKHLGALMQIVKLVLVSNSPTFPLLILLVLSGIEMGLWCAFCKMLWNSVRMNLCEGMPVVPGLVVGFVVVLWLWTHGFVLAVADFLCQSWVVHWYYQAKGEEEGGKETALRDNWRGLLIKKMFRYHIGTCLYGSVISAYMPQFLPRLTKSLLSPTSPLLQNLTHLSRYSYIQTILQSLQFCTANSQTYKLRQRIKQKLPQIYMLGHFLQQTIKIMLPISGLYFWFIFTYQIDDFLNSHVVDFSPLVFLGFCGVVVMGVFLEVTTNVGHLFGIVSDTVVIVYSIDCEIQRVHYNQNKAYSVCNRLKELLIKLEVDIDTKPYEKEKLQEKEKEKDGVGNQFQGSYGSYGNYGNNIG